MASDISNAGEVLVADDDENDVFLLRIAFQKAGLPHTLIHVWDGEEAINYLRRKTSRNANQTKPKLLLLDLKMPRVDGFDVLRWLQACPETNSLPVVVLSSSTLPADKKKAKDLGAKDYFVKPSSIDELMTLVRALHERWLKKD